MQAISFTKMNGAGNDFVVVDNREGSISWSPSRIARLCDRHRGVGADGLLAVETALRGGDFRMRYFNSDGGEAEMCGNGARCFARFAAGLLPEPQREEITFETPAGLIGAKLLPDDEVELAMSKPVDFAEPVWLSFAGERQPVGFLNTGVPHAVVFVEDLEAVDVAAWGRALREHEHFAPKGTNVNFVAPLAPGEIAIRTYERGVEAETLACGTGVVASALLYHLRTQSPSPLRVRVRGGDTLGVRFTPGTRGEFDDVFLRGPAEITFRGEIAVA
jgi:diaminopimelate epimerase